MRLLPVLRWFSGVLSMVAFMACGVASGRAHGQPSTAEPLIEVDDLLIVAVTDRPEPVAAVGGTRRLGYTRATGYAGSDRARATAAALAADYGLSETSAWTIEALGWRCMLYRTASGSERAALIARLASDPRAVLVQPLQTFQTFQFPPTGRLPAIAPPGGREAAAVAPGAADAIDRRLPDGAATYNDPYFPLQAALAALDTTPVQRIGLGERVRVAVVDSAVDTGHPDLGGRVELARDFVGPGTGTGTGSGSEPKPGMRSGSGPRSDPGSGSMPGSGAAPGGHAGTTARGSVASSGPATPAPTPTPTSAAERHGTAVSGVIAAAAQNGIGIVGVAPRARLLALRACWSRDTGSQCNTYTLAQALAAAIAAGADVINLSLGGPRDPLLERLVEHAMRNGAIVVGAVPPGGQRQGFPVALPGVIAVGMLGSTAVDGVLAAPGRDVLTLVPGGGYDFVSGSSLAAAHVSGALALLRGLEPGLTGPAALRLLSGSTRDGTAGAAAGGTVVDVCRAAQRLRPQVSLPCASASR